MFSRPQRCGKARNLRAIFREFAPTLRAIFHAQNSNFYSKIYTTEYTIPLYLSIFLWGPPPGKRGVRASERAGGRAFGLAFS